MKKLDNYTFYFFGVMLMLIFGYMFCLSHNIFDYFVSFILGTVIPGLLFLVQYHMNKDKAEDELDSL